MLFFPVWFFIKLMKLALQKNMVWFPWRRILLRCIVRSRIWWTLIKGWLKVYETPKLHQTKHTEQFEILGRVMFQEIQKIYSKLRLTLMYLWRKETLEQNIEKLLKFNFRCHTVVCSWNENCCPYSISIRRSCEA